MFFRIALTAAAAATLALAQGGGDMGGGSGTIGSAGKQNTQAMDMSGGLRAQKESKPDQIVSKLKLNKDQKTEVESILQATFQESTPLRNQLSQARGAVAMAFVDGKATDEMLKAYTDLQAQMIGVEVKAFQKVYAILKPNQTTKAGEAFDLMAGLFDFQPGQAGRGAMGRDRGGR